MLGIIPSRLCRTDWMLSCAKCLFGHKDHWTPDPKVGGSLYYPFRSAVMEPNLATPPR
jgi:hypothetical protein